MCYGDGFRGRVLLGNLRGVVLACSRLSDSGEDAKVKGTRKFGGAKKGKPLLSSVSSRFTFVFVLSQFSGLNYLEAWNRLWLCRLVLQILTLFQTKNDIFHTRPKIHTRSQMHRIFNIQRWKEAKIWFYAGCGQPRQENHGPMLSLCWRI